MPATPRWLLAIPDAIRQLEALDRELLTRGDVEQLFGVSQGRAGALMTAVGAGPLLRSATADLVAVLATCHRPPHVPARNTCVVHF